jgi:imidazoleglycerol-phosphate dehydratase
VTRRGEVQRTTGETSVRVAVTLEGSGESRVETGVGFLDHMLELLAAHALLDLEVDAEGDLHVDEHHTVEDVGIVLGQALSRALGERRGIRRYGFLLPMDESLARVAVDLGGRPYLVFRADFSRERVGELPTELVEDFLRALSDHLRAAIHVTVEYGRNDHHKIEAIFKALGRALRAAVEQDPRLGQELPSTKGRIEGSEGP